MVASRRLILRFANFNPRVDTVEAHNQIFRVDRKVFWGWWKKSHEPDISLEIEEIIKNGKVDTILFDRHERQLYKTLISRIVRTDSIGPSERALIPEYYRESISKIPYFFELSSEILKIDWDESFGEITEDATVIIRKSPKDKVGTEGGVHFLKITNAESESKISLLHLTDLHFGRDHAFKISSGANVVGGPQRTMADAILRDVKSNFSENRIHGIIITGDITSKGEWDDDRINSIITELEVLRSALGIEKNKVFLAPGNHDLLRFGGSQGEATKDNTQDLAKTFSFEDRFRLFRYRWLGVSVDRPLSEVAAFDCGDFDLIIGVLNSSGLTTTQFTEYGYVGGAIDPILSKMARREGRECIKIVGLHHHVVPITQIHSPETPAVSLTLDAARLISEAQAAGVKVILHGHQHLAKVVKIAYGRPMADGFVEMIDDEDIYVLSPGTSGSKNFDDSLRENAYGLITVLKRDIHWQVRSINSAGGTSRTLMKLRIKTKSDKAN